MRIPTLLQRLWIRLLALFARRQPLLKRDELGPPPTIKLSEDLLIYLQTQQSRFDSGELVPEEPDRSAFFARERTPYTMQTDVDGTPRTKLSGKRRIVMP